jgi:TRAP-type mannitol/chloroaromatic compound transport system permease large subunit
MSWMAGLMFVVVCLTLLAGYPVAFTLGGVALLFGLLGNLPCRRACTA